jgi:NADPH:quinone reductase-like Zn-dependent oxidoreductase
MARMAAREPEHLALAPPTVERVYPFGQASEALRHLIEDRPFGKIVLAG